MNKIYSLKYSAATGGLIAVSELAKRVSGKTNRKLVATMLSLAVAGTVNAANIDISNVWARDYLDLAQNKGIFQPGATDVTITLKNGDKFSFHNLSIPDFSGAAASGAATAIGGSYSVTVAHNKKNPQAAETQVYAQSSYKVVDRRNSNDFEIQRLNKFVVETVGATPAETNPTTYSDALERYGIVTSDGSKKIIGFRAGSGGTSFINGESKISTNSAYSHDLLSASLFEVTQWDSYGMMIYKNDKTFRNLEIFGDSGPGAYLYDNKLEKWVLVGTTHGIASVNGDQLTWITKYNDKLVSELKDTYSHKINLNGNNVTIKNTDITLHQNNADTTGTQEKITKDKDIVFTNGGNVLFKDNLDFGSGGIIFDEGHEYNINGQGFTFKGAGIDIGKESIVNWNALYSSDDVLHKIGPGTLNVQKKQGANIKIGEGNVILNEEGTFNNIYLASGNGKVILNKDNSLGNDQYAGIFFTKRGGTLDLNGHNQTFTRIAATDDGTTITNSDTTKEAVLAINNEDSYIYHGNINGNIKLTHNINSQDKKTNAKLILDGSVNTKNDVEVSNASLTMQGHATEHAIFRSTANHCSLVFLCGTDWVTVLKETESSYNKKFNSDHKSNNQQTSFDQPDWKTGVFKFDTLHLNNADFSISRNANVEGNISANKSAITIGDKNAYIDNLAGKNITNNGFDFKQTISTNLSIGETKFTGGITAHNSQIAIGDQAVVTLNGATFLNNTPISIDKGAKVIAQNSMFTTKGIDISGELTMMGIPEQNSKTVTPGLHYAADGFRLSGGNANFIARNMASVTGNIYADDAATITLGQPETETPTISSAYQAWAETLLYGFDTAYRGAITAPKATVSMNNAIWHLNSQSSINRLETKDSMVRFTGDNGKFTTLTVDNLTIDDSAFVLRANLAQADQLVVNKSLSGKNNLLLVDFIEKNGNSNGLNIDLVSAPKGTAVDVFKATTRSIGFSDVTPVIEQKNDTDKATWTLIGYKSVANADAAKKATLLMSGGYKAFLAEVNNLNKRMGDLRDINGESGAWARIMSGTGSAGGGFSDNYTHVQVGADNKHELDGLDLFTGVTMTYTDSHAGSDAFSGETKSVGAGLYASAMFESGAYIDLIGKYVHHDNEYTATFAGLGTRDYSSHSWYAGAEVGYRYHVTDSAWIEPQAELVYGAVSGKQFSWKDQGMNLTMKDKDFNPLIGRTGVDVGKSFSGKDWKVTARAGLGYQFDLFANGETVLRDASGEKRIKGEKDGRMLMNVGLNAEIRDNLRFGLEFEKSAFGKYNVDNAINANFRYSF
ncbi:TPA: serine protease autotransporter toxin Sat [Escherichia coli]|uniref:serine protease autotransporter toxin Sat n=1 Tax=Escherichia coli TaxID=562 RepID=UPI000E56FC39|nr:serine protease autotransporter toxin Sat [Escherichia coli]HAN3152878.1 serine protease autotransporter toxin Sat [Escherichia coli O25b:H4-ST131]EGO3591555.1 serine protease autotransporter toxin Sat [Escherichia coli]ELR9274530.1 serine protease autotransporter toxin Sat [Escherichia coli]NBE40572.1 serine protease autotransporter toxin Sat [Escherichia coli]HAJ5426127.1 serine protease autotransporter toxin Sat [Escherichia coli]